MKTTPDQLDILEQTGIFERSGLNDIGRFDMGEEPFLAIDPRVCHEVDDAIRVQSRRQGGFLVQIAIADAGQIRPDGRMFEDALHEGKSRYDNTNNKLINGILPREVIRALQLKGKMPRSALVIEQSYTHEAEPVGDIDIIPSTVIVQNIRQRPFGRSYMRQVGIAGLHDHPLTAFDEAHRRGHGLPYSLPEILGGRARPVHFAKDLVKTYMEIANTAAATFTTAEDIPILGRQVLPNRWVYVPHPEAQTHVTSPLRRAADIITHLQIGYHLAGVELPFDNHDLADFATDLNVTCAPPALAA